MELHTSNIRNPFHAATHVNPYPYYSYLVKNRPLYYDTTSTCWVASDAKTVELILNSDHFDVRPKGEPIPNHLLGTKLEMVFSSFVRMNDGDDRINLKNYVIQTLESFDPYQIIEISDYLSKKLYHELALDENTRQLNNYIFRIPLYAVSSLLGAKEDEFEEIEYWIQNFIASLSPDATNEMVTLGESAFNDLNGIFAEIYKSNVNFSDINVHLKMNANIVGLLMQTYQATAGLIASSLKNIGNNPFLFEYFDIEGKITHSLVEEVIRFDSPVQNTKRFANRVTEVNGKFIQENDMVLVQIAAANRDPSINENPHSFDIYRKTSRNFTFGSGPHACPGKVLASLISESTINQLMKSTCVRNCIQGEVSYYSSPNLRIPIFVGGTNL